MKIGIDVYPDTLIPSNVSSYASKSIVTLFYDPIYSCDDRGLCEIQQVNDKEWRLLLKNRYWSNGDRIVSSDIIKTFQFFKLHNLSISKELDIIKNWTGYRKEKIAFDEVGIVEEDDQTIYICTDFNYNLSNILSNIELTPIFIRDGRIKPISSGVFSVQFGVNNRFKPNKFHPATIVEDLELVKIEEVEDIQLLYEEGKIDVTPTTLYKENVLEILDGEKVEKESNIHVSLFLNSRKAFLNKEKISKIINSCKFINIIRTSGYFFEKMDQEEIESTSSLNLPNLKFGVTPYYPNFENVARLTLEKNIVEIPLHLTVDKYKAEEVDVVYMIHRSNIENEFTLLLSQLSFIDEEDIDNYLDLLNSVNIFNLSNREKTKINHFLSQYSKMLPIGNVIHKYRVRHNPNQFFIDENDSYYIV